MKIEKKTSFKMELGCGDFWGTDRGSRGRYGGITGDRRRLEVVNTQYRVQMMSCGIAHLKPV